MGTTDHHPKAIQMSSISNVAERVSVKRHSSNATCYRVYMGLGSPLSSGKMRLFADSSKYLTFSHLTLTNPNPLTNA